MGFIPDQPEINTNLKYQAIGFPQAYLEDGLAGYTSKKSLDEYQGEIFTMLKNAGARRIDISSGTFEKRPAYKLTFEWGGIDVQIVQVALPIRQWTKTKLEQSKQQALYHLFNEVRMELERRHFHPHTVPFVTYMIPAGQPDQQTRTFAELIANADRLALPKPADVVDGEVVE